MKTGACKRRVAVTGIGVVSPNGLGLAQFWNATRTGMSGIDTISLFDARRLPCRIAGEVKDFCAEKYFAPNDIKRVGRVVPFAVAATREAIQDAQMPI